MALKGKSLSIKHLRNGKFKGMKGGWFRRYSAPFWLNGTPSSIHYSAVTVLLSNQENDDSGINESQIAMRESCIGLFH